jgi:Flp pilus assembly pilin Flp
MVDRLNSLMTDAYLRLRSLDLRREEGQTLTEYALVLGVIVLGVIAALGVIGTNVKKQIQDVCSALVPGDAGCSK